MLKVLVTVVTVVGVLMLVVGFVGYALAQVTDLGAIGDGLNTVRELLQAPKPAAAPLPSLGGEIKDLPPLP